MKLSEAINLLAGEYLLGCAEFFSRRNPDPWEGAYSDLGMKVGLPEAEFEKCVDEFVALCRKLLLEYRASGERCNSLPWFTGFYSRDPEEAKNRGAIQDLHCVDCMRADRLGVLRTKNGVVPICKECKENRTLSRDV